MEAGLLPLISTLSSSWSCPPTRHQSRFLSKFRSVQFVSSLSPPPPPPPASSGAFKVPMPRRNPIAEWVFGNDGVARIVPIFTGGTSLILVLLNRTFSGIAPVADASSSQSRADILTLALAVTNLLTGLVWLSIQPKNISSVAPHGIECRWIDSALPECSATELLWAWESLSTATCCRSFVVVHGGNCLLQVGVAAEPSTENGGVSTIDVPRLTQGSLYRTVVESGKQSYLANLSLYPGRTELPFLPSNTQVNISGVDGLLYSADGETGEMAILDAADSETSGMAISGV
ncbi:protein COFACTOR ASSEMBLY OF COMPLEX C SUBUNIT B CCB4, chloroplastic [Phalaenopsis equestris]|uniref:protein COFACTOR ASSEMBLY OF COMPLEX C SUBUNIT B CCB4, chloroplastic n=1 Tax=Phalaenopsis equestris TaxID=78828 RepID=UPI0009E4470A|nr:protein COFACTOR ASSEMBLY OF COMPLEX C SUBUNIT B CCB4, chloroplastic [Phalaenopsis equestris]